MMQPGGGMLSTAGWGITLDWSEEEQRVLENHMMRFPAERFDPLQRYLRIAAALPRKSVRDVALRVRWTLMQAQLKRRTGLDPRGVPGLPPMAGPKPMMPMAPPMPGSMPPPYMAPPGGAPPMMDGQATIEGPMSHLLDANLAILNHFRANMAAFKVHENTQLLVQFRDNILQILQAMEAMGGVMAEMPALPVRLNTELANSFLPSRPAGVMSYDGMMMMPPPPQPALNAPGMVPINGPGFTPGNAPQGPSVPGAGPPPQGPPKPPQIGSMPPPMVPNNTGHGPPPMGAHPHPGMQQQNHPSSNIHHHHPSHVGHPPPPLPPGSMPQGPPQMGVVPQAPMGGGGSMRMMPPPMQQQQQLPQQLGSALAHGGDNATGGGGGGGPQQQQQQQSYAPVAMPAPQNQ